MSILKYIDISEHQGIVDWDKLKKQYDAGTLHGVIIRAGRGAGIADKYWERNIKEANRVGVPAGVYWFTQANTVAGAKAEAEYCLKAIAPYRIELFVSYDFEQYTTTNYIKNKGITPTKALCTAMAKVFLAEIEKAGYYAILYTGLAFSQTFYNMAELASYDIWWAQYPNKVDISNPPHKCGIWQWGGSAIDGITTGNVDTNAVYADYKTVIAKAGLNKLKPTAKEYADGDGVIIEPASSKPTEVKISTLKWAKDLGIVSGETDMDKAIADAIYKYHIAVNVLDDKSVSGLLSEE